MDKDLATLPEGKGTDLSNLNMQQIVYVGDLMHKAGMFTDIQSAAAATVKVMAGQELGLTPFQAMNSFHIIKGRATMAANLMASKIKNSGKYDYRVVVNTDDVNMIKVYAIENGKRVEIAEEKFTKEDAARAGTQNMGRFPRNMLFARNISNIAKWHCPDVFGAPVYVDGEVIDEPGPIVNDEGDTIEDIEARREAEKKSRREHAAAAGTRRAAVKPDPAPVESEPEGTQPTEEAAADPEPETAAAEPEYVQDEAAGDDFMAPQPEPHTTAQRAKVMAILGSMGFKSDNEKRQVCGGLLGIELISFKDVTKVQAGKLIEDLEQAEQSGGAEGLRVMFVTEGA